MSQLRLPDTPIRVMVDLNLASPTKMVAPKSVTIPSTRQVPVPSNRMSAREHTIM